MEREIEIWREFLTLHFDNKFSRVLELFLPALIIKQSNWFFVRSKTLTNYCFRPPDYAPKNNSSRRRLLTDENISFQKE